MGQDSSAATSSAVDDGAGASLSVGTAVSPFVVSTLDGLTGDADLHVVVDLDPGDVALEAGDEAVHAGRGHDLVAHLDGLLQRDLLALSALLRPDEQEVHRHTHDGEREDETEGTAAAARAGAGSEDGSKMDGAHRGTTNR